MKMKSLSAVYGLTCTCGNIEEGQDVECQCDTRTGIRWYKGGTQLTTCFDSTCIPSPVRGYTFSFTGLTYKMTISTFSFTNCKGYNAKDTATQETDDFPYCPGLTMTKPTSGAQINIEENTPVEFICKMVSGAPAGTVEWYVDSGTPNNIADDVKITTDISSSTAIDNQEYTTTSTLTLSPSKSYTGYRVYCKATNKPEQTPLVSQKKPRLNILYYSGGPTITEGSSYRVIETRPGQLSCVVTGGKPSPTVTWNCNSGSQTSTSSGDRKTRTVTWTADRGNSDTCTCTSSQTGLQPRTISTQITVLYPPSAPTFKISGQTITGDIKLIENSSPQIRCVSTGSPNPTIVWEKLAGSSATSSGRDLSFTSVSKTTDRGTYTCRASNVMDPTGLPIQPGARTSPTDIVVLYPPNMLNFYFGTLTGPLISSKTIDVIKGDTLSIGCKSMDGEPEPTIRWNGQTTNDPILTVQQIGESLTGKTCTATNQMLASGTSTVQSGSISDNISFNVLIPPTITKCEFYNNKTNSVLTNENTLMILEGESFTLTCSAAGKPTPNPSWDGPMSTVSSWSLPVNDVTRQRKGTYTFSATSVMEPSYQPSRTITANVTIQIDILYPPVVEQMDDLSRVKGSTLPVDCSITEGFPAETTTQWKRDIDSETWNNKPLYIQSIKKSDAGRYTCVASNTMRPSGDTQSYHGRDEKHFVLTVLYEPDVPTEFRHVETMATQTTLQLEWKPGSNGGPPQTFYIKYKTSSSLTWSYVDVSDNGESIMRYQLTGLKSDTMYQLIIYSSNIKGNSSESMTVTAKTKGDEEGSDSGALIGGVVGGLFGITVIVIVVIVVLRRYRFQKGNAKSNKELKRRNQRGQSESSEGVSYYNIGRDIQRTGQSNAGQSNEGRDIRVQSTGESNNEATYYNEGSTTLDYEVLNNQNRDSTTYSTLQPARCNDLTDDDTAGDENKAVYENLKLRVI